VPGERILYSMIGAVCTDPRGPAENTDLLSCDYLSGNGCGFRDVLRQKPYSLFILLGWRSISIASMMMLSMCLGRCIFPASSVRGRP
jgi:hypothetical protein